MPHTPTFPTSKSLLIGIFKFIPSQTSMNQMDEDEKVSTNDGMLFLNNSVNFIHNNTAY